jgi:hypothetical protein
MLCRTGTLKSQWRRELVEILGEVHEEEEKHKAALVHQEDLLKQLEDAHARLAQSADWQRTSATTIESLTAQNDELFKALETAEAGRRNGAEQAQTAAVMYREEAVRRREDKELGQHTTLGLQHQAQAQQAQAQSLLERLSQRDNEVCVACGCVGGGRRVCVGGGRSRIPICSLQFTGIFSL